MAGTPSGGAPPGPPQWRRTYDTVEGAVTPRVEAVVRSEPFAIAVGLASRLRHGLQAEAERRTRQLLHAVNLPAGSDVTRLLAEIGQLRRQVHELSTRLEGRDDHTGPRRTADPPAG